MESKKINQLATNVAPVSTDLTIIGDPITGVSKKITLLQLAAIFSGSIAFYTNYAAFPATGIVNTIYCAKDTQKLYLWSGSAYVETFPSQAVLNTYQLLSAKGVANGYASLDSAGKVPIAQLPSSIMEYKGMWNASTNTPTLANGTGDTGDVYICNVAGSVNFGAGVIVFAVGDYVIYSGSIWQRSSGAVGTVTSVGISTNGNSITIGSSPITTSGTITANFAGTSLQYINGLGNLITFPILTGYVPYTGATQDVDLGAFSLNGKSLHIKGTAGNGHLGLKHQSASATASANEVSLFADSLGDLSWLNGNIYLSKFITSSNTANRTYTFPNASGTIALLESTQTFSGLKTFSTTTNMSGLLQTQVGIYLNQSTQANAIAPYTAISGIANGLYICPNSGTGYTLLFPTSSTYTYTFPAATGTLALTSSLSSYVPYTGATANVDLGAFDLTVNSVKVGKGAGSISSNTILGVDSLNANTTGANNTAVGYTSLKLNTTASNNTAIGYTSLALNTSGSNNSAVGHGSLQANTTGINNTALGLSSLYSNTTGQYNTAIGVSALYNNLIGEYNTALGFNTLSANTANNNTAIGNSAGSSITTGSNNTIIGAYVGTSTLTSNVILADGAGNIRFQWDGTNIKLNNNIVGSNAYTSTAYLPLIGGTLTGQLNSNSNFNGANFFISSPTAQPSTSASVGMSANTTSGYLDLTGYIYGLRIIQSSTIAYGPIITTFENNGNITTTGGNTLEGITNIKPNANFTITQNSVVPFTLVSSGAIANSFYLTGRKAGFGTATPRTSASGSSNTLDVKGGIYFGSTSSESCTINNDDSMVFNIDADNSGTSNFFRFATNTTQESGGTELMRILEAGNVVVTAGISSSPANAAASLTLYSTTSTAFSSSLYCLNSSSTNCMLVRGDGYGYLLASAWAYGSDLRMKENILDVENGIDMVLKMKPKHFDYISGTKNNIGFIAQDIQEIIPQAISIPDETNGMLALKTDFLVPYLVKAIQEQQTLIEILKARLDKAGL